MDAIVRQGTATTGSRLANGTFREHVDLEEDLKAFFGARSAIVFTTGYQANLAAISTLAGRGDHLLIDADSHACIYDGCRLSDAETIRFRHNSPEDLAKRLARLPEFPRWSRIFAARRRFENNSPSIASLPNAPAATL